MARLLDDLLDVSRINRGRIELRMESVDLAALVRRTLEAADPAIRERRHELAVALPAEPLMVVGDPIRLEQVVVNLVNNAAKYTEPGGRIALESRREGREVVLRIRDNGIGIAPEMLTRIFDLFVQVDRRVERSQGGVGIGLTLVRKLVELHGGTVEAYSEGLGCGSEFVIRLPAPVAPNGERRPPAKEPDRLNHAATRHRVLVVDDNVDAAVSLGMLLKLAGQDVRVAYDGPAALRQASDFRPELVLLDIGMPGMDGYEVCRRLRRESALERTTVVALTGWGQDEDRRRSHEAGFDHHIVKPVEPERAAAPARRPARRRRGPRSPVVRRPDARAGRPLLTSRVDPGSIRDNTAGGDDESREPTDAGRARLAGRRGSARGRGGASRRARATSPPR